MNGGGKSELVFIGDVHLDQADEHLEAFLFLLDTLSETASTIVFAGDLFNLWIGKRRLEQPHQKAVLDRFERLRQAGVTLRYIEGNRDYRIARAYVGRYLERVAENGIVERFGGRSIFAIHGDMANTGDRQYRTWRRLSRSYPVWLLFNALPGSMRMKAAEILERKLRVSNLGYKSSFPEEEVRAYAEHFFRQGHDTVVLGHFHVERDLAAAPPSSSGRIIVLPEWKGSRRHLRVTPDGEISFVDS